MNSLKLSTLVALSLSALSLLSPLTFGTAHAGDVLGLHASPLHVVIAIDMTGSSKNPAFEYSKQARLIAQSVLLNQVRAGDSVTVLQVCNRVKTVADFNFVGKDAKLSKADILRYSGAVTESCKGRGSALSTGFQEAAKAVRKTPNAKGVVVFFTDGAYQDDAQAAQLRGSVGSVLAQKNLSTLFVAGLSPENAPKGPGNSSNGGSVRDAFNAQIGQAANDPRVIEAGAYDLRNIYPTFAAAVKAAR